MDNSNKEANNIAFPISFSGYYTDGIDHSKEAVNSDEECVFCGSTSVTITNDKDICHGCGYVYE